LFVELNDVLAMLPQKMCDITSAAITQPDPHELRRCAAQDRESVEVVVLAYEQAPMRSGQFPDRRIGGPALPKEADVKRIWEDVSQGLAQRFREGLIEQEPDHLTRQAL
jgi:hypothetical protein